MPNIQRALAAGAFWETAYASPAVLRRGSCSEEPITNRITSGVLQSTLESGETQQSLGLATHDFYKE
ncbi:MAG: hypothetical protein Q9187_002028 [Circinaria calcarea]